MPDKEQILKWYAQFKQMLVNEGIDVNNPADLLRIKAFKAADLDNDIRGEVVFPLDSKNVYKKSFENDGFNEFKKLSDNVKGKLGHIYEFEENIEKAKKDEKTYKNLANLYLDYDKAVKEASDGLVEYDTYKINHLGEFSQKMIDSLKLPDETNENDFANIEKLYNFAAEGMLVIESERTEPDAFRLVMADLNDDLVLSEEAGALMDKNSDPDFVPSPNQKDMLKSMGAIKHASEVEFNVIDGKEYDEEYANERIAFLNKLKENSKNADVVENGIIKLDSLIQDIVETDINEFNDEIKKDYISRNEFKNKYNEQIEKEFNDIVEKSYYQADKMHSLEKYVEKNADYSEFEYENTKSKQILKELVLEYKQYIGNDSELNKIITAVEKYANVDAHAGKNFREERGYVEKTIEMLDEYFEKLDEDDAKVNKKIHDFLAKVKDEKNMTPEEEKRDAELCAEVEMVDNRRRVHSSLSNYFNQLVNGRLKVPEHARKAEVDKTPYGIILGTGFIYMNGSGVKIKQTVSEKEVGKAGSVLASNLATTTAKKKDRPIFQHEPRMNDIQQGMLGNCYMLAGLQEVARLYPWKIKEAICDNHDGTATVRLFKRKKGFYTPVYIRVDKQEERVLGLNQGNEDCLWASLILNAYIISGMHPYRDAVDNKDNIDHYPGKDVMEMHAKLYNEDPEHYDTSEAPWLRIENGKAYADWKPDVTQVEGGNGGEFLETFLGKDFKHYTHDMEHLQSPLWLRTYNADYNDPEDIIKLAFVNDGDKVTREELEGTCKKSFDELVAAELGTENYENFNYDDEDIKEITSMFKTAIGDVKKVIQKELDDNGGKITGDCANEIRNIKDVFNAAAGDNNLDVKIAFRNAAVSMLLTKIQKSYVTVKSDFAERKTAREKEFTSIKDKLDKGLPVMVGSKHSDYINVMGGHEYSVIGAYTTDDNPPRNFLRIRNPWGNRDFSMTHGTLAYMVKGKGMNDNGLEYYTDKDGKECIRYVNMEDGVFDMEFDLACNEFYRYMVNESENLIKEQQVKSPEYIVEEFGPKEQPDKMTEERFREYLKCAAGLIKDITNTKSVFSSDTKSFTDLLKCAKNFKDSVIVHREGSVADMKTSLNALKDAANAYKEHLNNDVSKDKAEWSKRQTRREKICQTIIALAENYEKNPAEPKKPFEIEYAKKMLEANYSKNNITMDQDKLDENVNKLVNHKAFRQIIDKKTISKLHNADKEMIDESLKEFAKITKGYARDKGYNLETMEKEKTSSVTMPK